MIAPAPALFPHDFHSLTKLKPRNRALNLAQAVKYKTLMKT